MYKIVRITDKNDIDKHDPGALKRLGRIIDENESYIRVGYAGYLACTNDKSIMTTQVKKLSRRIDSMIIETQNSRYYLERIFKDG